MAAVLAVTLSAAAARSQDASEPPSLPWKLTVGEYLYDSYQGNDVNLRWRANGISAWAGVYSDKVFGTQARIGSDTVINFGDYVQVQPSLQAATEGLLAGSVNLQMGGSWFGILGFGRTDARPYFNLNFDPNDALTFGAGHRAGDGITYTGFVVADDRFHTGQRDWHLDAQIPFGASHATLDLLYKTGLSEAGQIAAWGFSVNYDWPRWFLRAAYDPYQNFSSQSAWRLVAGIRF
jgi:hypothetical protein